MFTFVFENINFTLIPSDVFSNFKILLYSVFKVRDLYLASDDDK